MLDTNEYGWYLDYTIAGKRSKEAVNSFNMISKLLEEKQKDRPMIVVYATETVKNEIEAAENPALVWLLNSLAVGVVRKSEKIEKLAAEFYRACRNERLHLVTLEDCEIVAASVAAGIKFMVTENRKTLNNQEVKEILLNTARSKGLVLPEICDSKKAYGELYA